MARHSRREILIGGGAAFAGFALPSNLALAQGAELPPTPECRDAHDVTPRQTEGPYGDRTSPGAREYAGRAQASWRSFKRSFLKQPRPTRFAYLNDLRSEVKKLLPEPTPSQS